jgi:hypothetical protein
MSTRKTKAQAEPEAPDAEPAPQDAPHGAAAMAGKVIALRCRGCSALVPTDHAWNKPVDGMEARCPACGTVTVWRGYEVVDPPTEPVAAAGAAGGPDTAGDESAASTPADPDAMAIDLLLRGATARDAGVSAARAKELLAAVRAKAEAEAKPPEESESAPTPPAEQPDPVSEPTDTATQPTAEGDEAATETD